MKISYLSIALLFFAFTANAQLPTNGLLAHWKFNGNANDATTNSHNGTTANISYTQGVTSNDTAALFNGTSSYITVPYQSDLNLTNYSICTKVKLNGFYTGNCQVNTILRRGSQFSAGYYALDFYDNQTDSSCTVTGDTSNFVFVPQLRNRPTYANPWVDTPTIRTNRWYCVIATFDSTNFKIYIDGVLRKTVPAYSYSGSIGTSNEDITIGFYRPATFPYWLNGAIDDLALYNRAFTANEVINYCGTAPVPDTNIVVTSLSDSIFCGQSSVIANYTVNYNFGTGNTFTLQLSDATGSFSSPTNIGSTSSTTSGTVTGNLPGTLTPGNYKLRIVSTNPVKTSSTKNIVIATPLTLTASISANPGINVPPLTPITFTATVPTSIISPNYQWMKNSVPILGATSNTYLGTSAVNLFDGDKIHVYVTSTQTCVLPSNINSDTLTLAVGLSVHSIENNKSINVYPNPNNGTFTIRGKVNANKVQVHILNTVGQTVYRADIPASNGALNKTIQLNDMPSGVYQIHLKDSEEVKNTAATYPIKKLI